MPPAEAGGMNIKNALFAVTLGAAALCSTPANAQVKVFKKAPAKIKQSLPPGPDLQIVAASVSKVWNCAYGAKIVYTVTVRVKNVGNQTAYVPRKAPTVLMRSTQDARWSAQGDFSHTGSSSFRIIPPGKTADLYFNVPRALANPTVMKGASHRFELILDPDNLVQEQREYNNRWMFIAPAVNACFTVF